MTFTFRKAERSHTPIFFGIAGPSGSGKTYSALRFATGFAQGRKICLIDTESGRGRQYADTFDYLYAELEAPFTPDRYMEAILDAKKAGATVVIIDSTSHMHEGVGGMLEQAEADLDERAGTDAARREKLSASAWIKPKRNFTKFVNRLLQLGDDLHVVFCFRAKEKLKFKKKTKYEIPREWEPITSEGMAYEMTALLMLTPKADGVPDLSIPVTKLIEPHRNIIPQGRPIDEAMGKFFADWSRGTGKKVRASDNPSHNGASTAETERVESAQQPDDLPVPEPDGLAAKDFDKLIANSQKATSSNSLDAWLKTPNIKDAINAMTRDQMRSWNNHLGSLRNFLGGPADDAPDDDAPDGYGHIEEPADLEVGYTGAAG